MAADQRVEGSNPERVHATVVLRFNAEFQNVNFQNVELMVTMST
jgi:hypothetical protein